MKIKFPWRKKHKELGKIVTNNAKDKIKQDLHLYIIEKNLPVVLHEIIEEKISNKLFKTTFEKNYNAPYSILLLNEKEQSIYQTERYKPIFSYAHSTIYAFDTKTGGFVTYDIENNLRELQLPSYTWDGLFVKQILFWWECEISDFDIIKIGDYLELNHTKEILQSINKETNRNGFKNTGLVHLWELDILDKINGIIK